MDEKDYHYSADNVRYINERKLAEEEKEYERQRWIQIYKKVEEFAKLLKLTNN